jgi:hypothetical protein
MTRLASSPVPDPLGGSVQSSVAMGFRFAGPGYMSGYATNRELVAWIGKALWPRGQPCCLCHRS